MRAKCICVGFRTFEKNNFFFKSFSWAACGFPAHRFPASLPGPLVQVSACVRVGPRRECGAVRWGIAEEQSSPWWPLTCSVTMAGLFSPLWVWARWLGQQSLAFERAVSLSLRSCCHCWDIPDQVEFSWWQFFGDDHVTTPWSIESSVIRAVDLDFHSVLTTNELSDLSEHFCFFLSSFVK